MSFFLSCFLSARFAPDGVYLHHSPHFDKAHAFHNPGYNSTLQLYKEVSGSVLVVAVAVVVA